MSSGFLASFGDREMLRQCATSMPMENKVTVIFIFWRVVGLSVHCSDCE